MSTEYEGEKPAMLFLDSAGIAGPVGASLREMGFRVMDVDFGADSPDRKCRFKRDPHVAGDEAVAAQGCD